MASKSITMKQLKDELNHVLVLAEQLNLHDGSLERVSIQRGVSSWIVSDPDNTASLFLPVSKGLGDTKSQAWRTLLNVREALGAVKLRHPEIITPITPR